MNKNDMHTIPLADLKSELRAAIGTMLLKFLTGGAFGAIDDSIRSVRRRWDQLTPPNAQSEERKSWSPSLVKARSEWDIWFQKFHRGIGTIEELDDMIRAVNAAQRPGAVEAEKIQTVSATLASMQFGGLGLDKCQIVELTEIGSAARQSERSRSSTTNDGLTKVSLIDEIDNLEKVLARKRSEAASMGIVPAPPPPPDLDG